MKLKLLFLFLILSISLVSAGQSFEIDFEKSPSYLIDIQEGDRIEFELNNSLHTVIVENVNENKALLAIFTFIGTTNNQPFYSDVNKDKFIKLDLDKNDKPDLYIIYNSSNKTVVTLRLQLPVLKNKDVEILPQSNFKKTNYLTYLLYLSIPIILLILVLFYINSKIKSKEKPSEEQNTIEEKQENKEQ